MLRSDVPHSTQRRFGRLKRPIPTCGSTGTKSCVRSLSHRLRTRQGKPARNDVAEGAAALGKYLSPFRRRHHCPTLRRKVRHPKKTRIGMGDGEHVVEAADVGGAKLRTPRRLTFLGRMNLVRTRRQRQRP